MMRPWAYQANSAYTSAYEKGDPGDPGIPRRTQNWGIPVGLKPNSEKNGKKKIYVTKRKKKGREREMMMMMFNTSEDMCMSIGVMASCCFFDDDSSLSVCHFHFQFRSFCP